MLARWLETINGTWRLRAACNPLTGIVPPDKIPEMFSDNLDKQRIAALFCNTACPVQQECLAFAVDVGDDNWVWGGTTETERRLLMRRDRKIRKDRQSA